MGVVAAAVLAIVSDGEVLMVVPGVRNHFAERWSELHLRV
jgi:hypothetical protein